MTARELIELLQKFPAFLGKEIQLEIDLNGQTIIGKITTAGYDFQTDRAIITVTLETERQSTCHFTTSPPHTAYSKHSSTPTTCATPTF